MYKPNFCAECGAQIVRERWRLWHSGKFCDGCAPRLRKAQIRSVLIAGLALFGIGLTMGHAWQPAPPPLIIERSQGSPPVPALLGQPAAGARTTGSPAAERPFGPNGSLNERPSDPNEIVSVCGARTKKGTPCSRRVRGTGRCWQHKGMSAIMPPEKLVVTGS